MERLRSLDCLHTAQHSLGPAPTSAAAMPHLSRIQLAEAMRGCPDAEHEPPASAASPNGRNYAAETLSELNLALSFRPQTSPAGAYQSMPQLLSARSAVVWTCSGRVCSCCRSCLAALSSAGQAGDAGLGCIGGSNGT